MLAFEPKVGYVVAKLYRHGRFYASGVALVSGEEAGDLV